MYHTTIAFHGVFEIVLQSFINGGITDISFNREHPLCSGAATPSFKSVSFTKASWICFRFFCPRRKRGGTSGGHFESLTVVNIHEVLNSIVSLLSFLRKKKNVPIRNESHNCWLFRCHFSQCPCFLKYFELTVSSERYCLCTTLPINNLDNLRNF